MSSCIAAINIWHTKLKYSTGALCIKTVQWSKYKFNGIVHFKGKQVHKLCYISYHLIWSDLVSVMDISLSNNSFLIVSASLWAISVYWGRKACWNIFRGNYLTLLTVQILQKAECFFSTWACCHTNSPSLIHRSKK